MAVRAESEENESAAELSRRAHKRVGVKLRVAVVLGRDTAYLAHTHNMSESGVLINDFSGPQLCKGRLVGLNLRGVVGDNADDESQQYLMRVVRHDSGELALRFVSDTE